MHRFGKISIFFALIAVIEAGDLQGGSSVTSRSEDGFGNYHFSYDVVDPLGATNGRYEEGGADGSKRGFYTLTDIDGRHRRVDYVADQHGFRAVVNTNEPGTATSEPANALYATPYSGPESNQQILHGQPVVHAPVVAPKPIEVLSSPAEVIHAAPETPLIVGVRRPSLALALSRANHHPVSHATRLVPVAPRRYVPADKVVFSSPLSHSRIVYAAPSPVDTPLPYGASLVAAPRVAHPVPLSHSVVLPAPVVRRVSVARRLHH